MAVVSAKFMHSQTMGREAETAFCALCTHNGWQVTRASTHADRHQHIDFFVSPLGCVATAAVDVKAIKCAQRGGKPDPTLVYIELKNVLGKAGWVKGKADYIVLQQEGNCFLCLERAELARYADYLATLLPWGKRSGVKGTQWARPGRDDHVLCLDRDRVLSDLQSWFFIYGSPLQRRSHGFDS